MLQKLDGVVLHVVRYSDKSNIVHIYTCQHGSMSFVIPATRSRKSLVNGALFRPLSLVEVEADVRSRTSLPPVKEARLSYPLESVPYDRCLLIWCRLFAGWMPAGVIMLIFTWCF